MWRFLYSREEILIRQLLYLCDVENLQHFLQLRKISRAARKAFADRMLYCRPVLYLEKGRGKIPHSENANVSLKQSDLSHFIPGLAYHCGKKFDDALLIPVLYLWLTEFFGAKLLYAYTRITNRLETGHCLIWFMIRLETGRSGRCIPTIYESIETSFCISMICELIGNRPLCIYDLWIDWTLAVVFSLG